MNLKSPLHCYVKCTSIFQWINICTIDDGKVEITMLRNSQQHLNSLLVPYCSAITNLLVKQLSLASCILYKHHSYFKMTLQESYKDYEKWYFMLCWLFRVNEISEYSSSNDRLSRSSPKLWRGTPNYSIPEVDPLD